MGTLSNSFTTVFDKAADRGHACRCTDKWIVTEHESSATMNCLEVNAKGLFLGFDHDLVKNIKDITTIMSSKLDDKDCDGIAFFTDDNGNDSLILVELKSNFDTEKIQNAFYQITMSFIKLHAWLSLCKNYSIDKVHLHFITACKCFKDDNQSSNIMLRISQAQQLNEATFETKLLKPLLEKHFIKVKMDLLSGIRNLPFNDAITCKDVILHLQLTKEPHDSQTRIVLDNQV